MEDTKTNITIDREAWQIIQTRIFDAPAKLVFQICMDPNLIPKWWGPFYFVTVVDKMDVKVGGSWQFVQTDRAGNEYRFNGVYKEIDPPRKVVQTFELEQISEHILTETATFEEIGGKTHYKVVSQYESLEHLEEMVQSGLEGGARQTLERLAVIVERS